MKIKTFFSVKAFIAVLLFSGVLAGCAENTEPDVRAYIHEKKAYSEIQRGQLQMASMDLEKALRDSPGEPTILNNLALIAFREGKYEKAVGYLEKARSLKAGGNDEPYILNEARILIVHHEYHRALALLSLIEPRHSWPKGYQKIMAEALLHNGQSSHALAILLDKRTLNQEQPNP